MPKLALGLIETVGLAAGIEAADAAVKSANVTLIGYELTKGDGMATIKVEGDVGAVQAAISAAKAAALKVGAVYSTSVIPRPANGLEAMIFTKDTVGFTVDEPKVLEETAETKEIEEVVEIIIEETPVEATEIVEEQEEQEEQGEEQGQEGICNICHDAVCPRRKGQPRTECIHHKDEK